jgi:hypothetical protein
MLVVSVAHIYASLDVLLAHLLVNLRATVVEKGSLLSFSEDTCAALKVLAYSTTNMILPLHPLRSTLENCIFSLNNSGRRAWALMGKPKKPAQ